MGKYLLRRVLHGIISVIIVVMLVMILIYSMINRNLVFAADSTFSKLQNNQKTVYKYRKWQEYGYLYYATYADFISKMIGEGELTEEERSEANALGVKPEKDSDLVAEYVEKFREYYEDQGYTVIRLDAVMANRRKQATGGQQQLFAYKNRPLFRRLISYFTGLFTVDTTHAVQGELQGKRGLTFTLHDPVYGGEKFSPAIIGNGTKHKYLLYFDNRFPYLHQNLFQINLGVSYTVNSGVDVWETMTKPQGSYVSSMITFPTGLSEISADDLHSAVYLAGSRSSSKVLEDRFTDDYTGVSTVKGGRSKMGYSFVIGILAVLLSYLIGVPMGIAMAMKKDKLLDKIGTIYIIFIIAVPSLAYIFLFRAIGGRAGLPMTFNMESKSRLMYVLPIISLALPSIGELMKWLRRYMIDQMNSDYVKFARSGGLSEGEIFSRHIFKNAVIPLVHGIPASVLGAMVGAIITERVYVVPGAGNMLTTAINRYDNGAIVGVTLFYAVLSVVSIILGDILMSMVDPRISFSSKDR